MDPTPEPAVPRRPVPWGALFGVLAVVLAVGWCAGVGYHRHELKLTANGRTVRLVSRRPAWEVALPDRRVGPRTLIGVHATASLRYVDFDAGGPPVPPIEPECLSGYGVVDTKQTVEVKGRAVRLAFSVNDRPFELRDAELRSGARRWELPAEGELVIDVDDLP
jgi:hypothetical protein